MYNSDASFLLTTWKVGCNRLMEQKAVRDEIMTVQEVADYLRISRTTVWRWCNEGRLPAFRIGREWRIKREALEETIAQSGAEYRCPA